jgi:primase-polymerase (primpol)-like protein
LCEQCGKSIVQKNAQARFCSTRCRVGAHRAAQRDPIPALLRERPRWVRHTATKVPLTASGAPASSTNPATWTDYDSARRSDVGAGIGFVLTGDGISCIDLDHCVRDGVVDPRALEYIAAAEPFYVELSPSGTGIHAWTHRLSPGRNRFTLDNGLAVEWYDTARYITVTGRPL